MYVVEKKRKYKKKQQQVGHILRLYEIFYFYLQKYQLQ